MEQNCAEVLETSSTQYFNQHELQVASERIDVINRLVKVEEKLDQITSAIDKRQIKMSTDIDSIFKRLDRITRAGVQGSKGKIK